MLTLQYLKERGACEEGISFATRNNLIGLPLSIVDNVIGDYDHFVGWLKRCRGSYIVLDEQGRIATRRSAIGDIVYTYDDNKMTETVDSNSRVTEYKDGKVIRVIDFDNVSTYVTDYNKDKIVRSIQSTGEVIKTEYLDENGDVVYIMFRSGNTIQNTLENGLNVRRIVYNAGRDQVTITERTYDSNGLEIYKRISVDDVLMNETYYTYDSYGNQTSEKSLLPTGETFFLFEREFIHTNGVLSSVYENNNLIMSIPV